MKKVFLAAALWLPLAAIADDVTFLIEAGVGIGKSGSVTAKNDKSIWCKDLASDRLTFVGARIRSNDVEIHGAMWGHDSSKNCDRSSYALGVGYVFDATNEDLYATWTPGIAYTWSDNKNFKNQRKDNTTWTLSENFQVFNRLAVGVKGNDYRVEAAYHNYGLFESLNDENFITIGIGLDDTEKRGTASTSAVQPIPPSPPVVIIVPVPVPVDQECKNGNGYGDDNHCHSK